MKTFKSKGLTAALLATLSFAPAHADNDKTSGSAIRADGHAPAGVMLDHMHSAGEFMVGYRYMYSSAGNVMLQGKDQASDAALAAAGFSTTPERMVMHMHMLDIMYAPTDSLTLMLMPQFMSMDMTMRPVVGAMAGGEHDGHSEHGGAAGGTHSHGTSGFGDTIVSGLVRLWDRDNHHLHMGLGLSLPTGSVQRRDSSGVFTHYMMQLGSGTWDLLPSLTYSGQADQWGWGAQASATIRLENANKSGFRFGDIYQATAWGSRNLSDWLSTSARLIYTTQADISGHYNGPHNHSSPADLQPNYGGDFLEAGLGLNAAIQTGMFAGHRFGAEVLLPMHQNVNGFQQRRDVTVHVSWSKAF